MFNSGHWADSGPQFQPVPLTPESSSSSLRQKPATLEDAATLPLIFQPLKIGCSMNFAVHQCIPFRAENPKVADATTQGVAARFLANTRPACASVPSMKGRRSTRPKPPMPRAAASASVTPLAELVLSAFEPCRIDGHTPAW